MSPLMSNYLSIGNLSPFRFFQGSAPQNVTTFGSSGVSPAGGQSPMVNPAQVLAQLPQLPMPNIPDVQQHPGLGSVLASLLAGVGPPIAAGLGQLLGGININNNVQGGNASSSATAPVKQTVGTTPQVYLPGGLNGGSPLIAGFGAAGQMPTGGFSGPSAPIPPSVAATGGGGTTYPLGGAVPNYDPFAGITPGLTGAIDGISNAAPYNGGYDMGPQTMGPYQGLNPNDQTFYSGLDTASNGGQGTQGGIAGSYPQYPLLQQYPSYQQTGSLMNGSPNAFGGSGPNSIYGTPEQTPVPQYSQQELDQLLGYTSQQQAGDLTPFTNYWNGSNPPSGYTNEGY